MDTIVLIGAAYTGAMSNTAPIKYSEKFMLRVGKEFVEALDEVRRLDGDLPSKAEAIRRAVIFKRDHKEAARKARKKSFCSARSSP